MRTLRNTFVTALLALVVAGCAAQRYAENTYAEAGAAFAHANGDDIGRWIATDPGITGAEQTALRGQLAAWLASPGVPAVDVAFDDAMGARLEGWALADPTLSDLTRRVVVQDIRSWRKLVAGRKE
jgi:hypothetical protein